MSTDGTAKRAIYLLIDKFEPVLDICNQRRQMEIDAP